MSNRTTAESGEAQSIESFAQVTLAQRTRFWRHIPLEFIPESPEDERTIQDAIRAVEEAYGEIVAPRGRA